MDLKQRSGEYWNLSATERKDTKGVIERFDNYCNPRKNIPFERILFNSRQQESGELFDRYVTALRQIADKCAFDVITPDDLLRNSIVDNKVRKRLVREPELNLAKTLDICLSLKVLSGNFIRFEIDIGA